jgi:hypothetical protein
MGPWTIDTTGAGLASLTWDDEDPWWREAQAPAALAELMQSHFAEGVRRIQAEVPRGALELRRALQRAGLRPEGVARGAQVDADGAPVDAIRLARLADDPAPGTREGFLSMLNATLPTKRVIAQGLIRNETGEILMCQLTYKQEWDLPGGVVDPHESPAGALDPGGARGAGGGRRAPGHRLATALPAVGRCGAARVRHGPASGPGGTGRPASHRDRGRELV